MPLSRIASQNKWWYLIIELNCHRFVDSCELIDSRIQHRHQLCPTAQEQWGERGREERKMQGEEEGKREEGEEEGRKEKADNICLPTKEHTLTYSLAKRTENETRDIL